MIVTDLTGESEMLTGYKDLAIKQKINGEYSLSFLLLQTRNNEHSYPMAQEESLIEYDGQTYCIKGLVEKSIGDKSIKSIRAEHIFFSIIDHFVYDLLVEGDYAIGDLLASVFANSGYAYTVEGVFSQQYFEKFGEDNALSLINLICNQFGVEIEIDNKHVVFKNQIGHLVDFQFRYKHNTKTISKSVDTTNLSTVIRGYADVSEYGIYMVEAEYRSPLIDVYGERHAKPIYADDLVLESSLLARLEESINDRPEISYSLDFVELKKEGYPEETFNLGDTVFTIWEPLDIDITTRIVEYTIFPESSKSPVVTLSNFKNNASDILADFGRTKENIDKIITDNGTVRFSAMDEQVKRSTEALLNSMTELEYPPSGGIVGRDKTNPSNYTILNSNGFGIYRAGQLFEAITSAGFNLSAGVIGKLKANNIDVDGLIAQGVITRNRFGGKALEITNANGVNGIVFWGDNEAHAGMIYYDGISGELVLGADSSGKVNIFNSSLFVDKDVYSYGKLLATREYVDNAIAALGG